MIFPIFIARCTNIQDLMLYEYSQYVLEQ